MIRLVQLRSPDGVDRVAVVEEPKLRLLHGSHSILEAAQLAIEKGRRLSNVVDVELSRDVLDYNPIYDGRSDWKLRPTVGEPAGGGDCLITGTGLTHRASAESRADMHGAADGLTDSMKMYRLGVEGGRPARGAIGAQPEWFYKGRADVLRAHGEPLDVPSFALDGGEEAEIAGVYLVGPDGTPFRVGLVQGNEFSDHVGEARNYLYLAESKLRTCSIGPELVVPDDDGFFAGEVRGRTRVERRGETVWQGELASGERWMCHTLANLEHHHFKNPAHRRPGDAHVHFLGADAFSFRDAIRLEDGDEMVIEFAGFGRPLRNPVRIDRTPQRVATVRQL